MPSIEFDWGNPVIESLENFYGLPVEQLAKKLRADLSATRDRGAGLVETATALRCDEFSQIYLEQQHSRTPNRISGTDMQDGHLRAAFIGRELVPIPKGGRPTVYVDGKHLGNDRLSATLSPSRGELKAALCYAHDVVLEDPFDEEQDIAAFVREIRDVNPDASVLPNPSLFVDNVVAVSELAPLVRQGVIRFSPRSLAMNPRLTGRNASSAWDVDLSGAAADGALVDRMMRIWLHSGTTVVPVFDSDGQEGRFAEVLGLLSSLLDTAESARLRKLATLTLPAAVNIDLRQMLDIRVDDAFQRFRSRQRSVLAAIDREAPDDARARALFREEMRAAANEVTVKTRRQALLESGSPKLIGWGVGAVVGASFDWRAAAGVLAAAATTRLADFLTSSAAQALSSASSRSTTALHHHFATLGEKPDSL